MLEGDHSDRQGPSLNRVVSLALANVDIALGGMRRGEGVVVLNKNSRICDIFIFLNKLFLFHVTLETHGAKGNQ